MLNLKPLLLWILVVTYGYSYCYYQPCDFEIQKNEQQAQIQLQTSFAEVQANLQLLEEAYKEELKTLILSNENLEKQIAITKSTLLEAKELLFLLKQTNHLEANNLNVDALKEKE